MLWFVEGNSSKRCVTCHRDRPLTDFNKRAKAQDGLQARCRDCAREWYLANRIKHMSNVRQRNNRVREENRAQLEQFLLGHPCTECGETDLRVLDLDHDDPGDKLTEVGRLMASSLPWRRIEAEIAKCTVRCANCHRRRTAEQLGYWRQAAELRRRGDMAAAAQARLTAVLGSG